MDARALLDADQAGEAEWTFGNATFRFKRLTADLDAGVLHAADGRDIALRPQAFAVLEYLSKHPNRIVSKEDLMRAVWGGVAVTEYSLVQCVTDIRRALGDTDHTLIKTVPKRGYLLVQEPPAGVRGQVDFRWKIVGLALLTVLLASLGMWGVAGPSPSTPVERREVLPSVVVLPFESLGGDSTKRLTDGLTHDLTTDLASFPEFHVLVRKNDGRPR